MKNNILIDFSIFNNRVQYTNINLQIRSIIELLTVANKNTTGEPLNTMKLLNEPKKCPVAANR